MLLFSFNILSDLAQQLHDADLDDDGSGDADDSVSTLQSTEDEVMTDFEALADVQVEDQGEAFQVED